MAPPANDSTGELPALTTPSISVPQKSDSGAGTTNGVAGSYSDQYFVASSEMAQLSLPKTDVPYVSGSDSSPELPRRRQLSQRAPDDSVMHDPWCDPANPRSLHFQDVCEAAYKIKSGIMVTPCTRSHISEECNMQLFFKKDYMQYTGSFKERGARYTLMMLTAEQRRAGVIAASAGNHALALCYHGRELGVTVTVVMPVRQQTV